jgi:hypothetical protein
MGKHTRNRIILVILPYVVLLCYILMIQKAEILPSPNDISPMRGWNGRNNAKVMHESLIDRVRTLELKLNTYLSYKSDPFFWN